ncbi:phage tail sheath family protein [Paenibacillus sp. YN15]|uniref:phage tail sheath family protein n=1 Tax=Paenibacillus sp. YN15 TaxID=1742774 RepID=UPI000DCAF630|nr:phage tail sheath family protein [Paenibacillus sp. YN15]RAU98111.1 phage tail sheath protein [Paenibacillus sp. YN15]
MAGGTWTTQNKVRPGAYINIKSAAQALGAAGDRGIVSLPLILSWGPAKQVVTVEAGEDVSVKLGYPISDPALLLVREALKRAKTLLLYRLNTGTKASVTSGNLTATAKYGGVRGNDLTVRIAVNVDNAALFDVTTLLAGVEMDKQTVADIGALQPNDWVVWAGTGALEATAGAPLVGGANGSATAQEYLDYLGAIEVLEVNTIGLPVTDAATKAVFVSFAKRLREDEGKKIQVVVENYPAADYEGVISVKNGIILTDGTVLTAAQVVAWVAGATAGAQMNQSLTYAAYDDAVDVTPKYTNSQIIAALQAGELLFTGSGGKAVVEQDINTLHSFSPDKGKAFAKNRVLRVLDGINNDFRQIFADFYTGKISNNADGRNLLKNEYSTYLETLQGIEAIQNFDAQKDLTISEGADLDSVVSELYVQPVDSMEKLYLTITVS